MGTVLKATAFKVGRVIVGVFVALVTGMWGLIILFSDSPGLSTSMWLLYVIGSHVVPGFVIGVLLPSRWYLSVLASWGAVIIGLLFLIAPLFNPELTMSLGSLKLPALGLLVIPTLVALAGFTGSKVVRRVSQDRLRSDDASAGT